MYTLAELSEFRQWIEANLSPGPRRSAATHGLTYCGELLVDARREMAQASERGQVFRAPLQSRATMVQNARDDADALVEGMTGMSSSRSQKIQDLAAWLLPQIPAGPRRTQMQRILTEAGVLENVPRRQFVAGSAEGQISRTTPPARATMVLDAVADGQALYDAISGLTNINIK